VPITGFCDVGRSDVASSVLRVGLLVNMMFWTWNWYSGVK
jgi:hypothetical protein